MAQVKFDQICTFIGSFRWKYVKFQLKVQVSYVSSYWTVNQNSMNFCFKNGKIWWILIRALKSLKDLHFNWSLLCKVYNVLHKKVQRRYISWHWKTQVIQNLKKKLVVCGLENDKRTLPNFHQCTQKLGLSLGPFIQSSQENWLVLPKITWEIWQLFTRALESLKIGTLVASFCLNSKIYQLKIYRGVVCHDNEEWCKSWEGIDLSVQNWHEKFDEFWPEHSKI